VIFDLHFLELPDQTLALAVAGLVFEEQDVVLGGRNADPAIVVRVFVLLLTGKTGTAEVFGSGGRKARTCSTVPSGMSRRSAGAP
jgi:hypothetical protein